MILNLLRSLFILLICQFSPVYSEGREPDLTLMVPMRDGFELPTDLYLPSPDARNLPCILLRSPAGRNAPFWKPFTEMAKAGYVVAIQDTRSALDSEGKTFPFISDGWGKLQDGYDSVEWLAKSPYTNGKIGTWGSSALGITQLLMAPSNPPHLVCQYIQFAASSLYHHGLYPGGQFLKNQAEGWLKSYAPDPGVLNYVANRPFYNEFWHQLNTNPIAHHVRVPGLFVAGWYDTFLQGTIEGFRARQLEGGEGAKGKQKLVIGPWTHFWPLCQKLGEFPIPNNGCAPPYAITPKVWFDYYLKGEGENFDKMPPVVYYLMGPFDGTESLGNRWKTADSWPVPAVLTPYYLSQDHRLIKDIPSGGTLSYTYDPLHPLPTLGGRNLFLDSGPADQRPLENRADILVFTSPVLEKDLEVTGNLSAKLYVSTDQNDTDIVVRLTDVYPDGRSILISDGHYRLGTHSTASKLNQPTLITVDLWATGIVFAKGHALRVTVSSSNYPKYEKNMNLGYLGNYSGKCQVAKNSLYFGENYPSHLLLPVVENP